MDTTSAAEANLNARVRPQIVALRAKTPYPKRRPEGVAAIAVGGPRPALSLVGARPAADGRPAAGQRTPIKLTRRGRIVVGTLIGLAMVAVAVLIWFGVAGQAEASSHVGPRVPASDSVSRVVVRPGDTLWAIAATAEPNADPRATMGEILDLNSLTSTAVRVGQVLLVPKG
ncbi:MAG TPA: LysM peptidoglycan-binding domain-containing protein [Streptosporangiaceae bacterium]|nr:LysM peptidoglycan-binding domain-containing protein [Streptosporangiaceae bacterium]